MNKYQVDITVIHLIGGGRTQVPFLYKVEAINEVLAAKNAYLVHGHVSHCSATKVKNF